MKDHIPENQSPENANKVSKTSWVYFYIAAAVMCLGLGLLLGAHKFSSSSLLSANLSSAQLLPSGKPLTEFNLEDAEGKTLDASLFRGHWSLIFFGFTSCPDFCPLELQKMGKALRLVKEGIPLKKDGHLQVVFVTVDPERDSAKKIGEYVKFFSPDIIGMRGASPKIADLAHFFGATYERSALIDNKLVKVPAGADMPENAGDQYVVNHSTRVFIVDPSGNYIGSFTPPYEAETLAADLQILSNQDTL